MEQKTWSARLFPHIIAIGIFALLTLIVFKPVFLDNKVLQQSDVLQFKGASHEATAYRDSTGKESLWTNSMFGGMPAYQISTEYKGNILRYVGDILTLGFPYPAQIMFILLLGFYILLITLDVDVWLSVAGAIGFGFATFNFILLASGHNTEIHALAFVPICLAGILMIFRRKYLAGGVLAAVALSLEVMTNHLQIAYYLFLLVLVFIIIEFIYAIKEKTYKHFATSVAIVGIASVFAVLTNLSLLWTTYEYGKETIRGQSNLTSNTKSHGGLDEDYAFGWSYGKMETMTLLIPDFYGGSSNEQLGDNSNVATFLQQNNVPPAQADQYLRNMPAYWGDQPFTSGPVYVGAILVFLFVLGLFFIKGPIKWWLLISSALAIMLAWGHNFLVFNDLMFKFFPGLNKFRTVTMALVIPQITFPLMSILVLQKISEKKIDTKELLKYLKYALYIVGGICALIMLIGPAFFDFKGQDDKQLQQQLLASLIDDRKTLMRMDAFRSLLFILLSAAAIYLYYTNKIKKNIFYGSIILLVFLDLFLVGRRYLNDDNFVDDSDNTNYFQPTQADQTILRDKSLDYRVLNLAANTFNDAKTSYYHKSIGGYHAAKLRRYQELIDHQLQRTDENNPGKASSPNISVLNMLNTKYVITSGQNGQPVAQMNPGALGNAWFVDSYKLVANSDSEMAALNNFNPKQVCFIDKKFADQLHGLTVTPDSAATIKLLTYDPNDLVYHSSDKNEGVAVFSEIYYSEGWDVYVDGNKTPYFRCDYLLRGMVVPAGEHKIEFKFEPKAYYTGESVSLYSSLLLIILGIGAIVMYSMQTRKNN